MKVTKALATIKKNNKKYQLSKYLSMKHLLLTTQKPIYTNNITPNINQQALQMTNDDNFMKEEVYSELMQLDGLPRESPVEQKESALIQQKRELFDQTLDTDTDEEMRIDYKLENTEMPMNFLSEYPGKC